MDELILRYRDRIRALIVAHGGVNPRVFGSRARGDSRPDSDIDLLVDAGERRSRFFPGGLVSDLEEMLKVRADVVTEKALHPSIRERILREAQPL